MHAAAQPSAADLLAFMASRKATPDSFVGRLSSLTREAKAVTELGSLFPESAARFEALPIWDLAAENIGWQLMKAKKLECFRHYFPDEFAQSGLKPESPHAEWMREIVKFYELVDQKLFPVSEMHLDYALESYEEEASIEEADFDTMGLNEIPLEPYFPDLEWSTDQIPRALQLIHFLGKSLSATDIGWFQADLLTEARQFDGHQWNKEHWITLRDLCSRRPKPLSFVCQALRIAWKDTGNPWIDWDGENYGYQTNIAWAVASMEYLHAQYLAAGIEADKITELSEWLSADVQRVWEVVLLFHKAMAPQGSRQKLRNPDPLPDLTPRNLARIMVAA